jgi:membrane-associated protease RseP (regulator of RpoE activity)
MPPRRLLLHILLFLCTLVTTTIAGTLWLNRLDFLDPANLVLGLPYSLLLLLMLTSHEFGHYFAARYHKLDVTLPYYIPFPSFEYGWLFNPFGTLGAVIRLKSPMPSRKVLFDVGAAGPIAGFVVTLAILIIGFATLPPREYIYTIHPEYADMETWPDGGWQFGKSILFVAVGQIFSPEGSFIPPMNEVYHYPLLCVGWFGLLVTAINLIPFGPLDGGHISYAMFGHQHFVIGRIAFAAMVVLGLLGFLPLLGVDIRIGGVAWLVWALAILLLTRVFRFQRGTLDDETPLDPIRRSLGWSCYGIFLLSFMPNPIIV